MATITAAAGGGTWGTNATWVGNVKPTAADDVLLTGTSGNVTIDAGAVGRSLNCTGYTGTLTNPAGITLTLGDATAGASNIALKFVAGMTYSVGDNLATISFVSTSATQQTVTTGGVLMGRVLFNGAGSSYLLSDSFTSISGAYGFGTGSAAGIINTNNLSHTWGSLSTGGGTFTLGSSAISITGGGSTGVVNITGTTTFTSNTAVLTLSGASQTGISASVATNLNGASIVFSATVVIATVSGNLTINNLTFSSVSSKTAVLTFSGNPTITGTLTVSGNSLVNRPLVQSSTIGTARTITTAAFSFANVDFMDITSAGAGGTWTGTSMGNCLGNTGITFDAPATQTHTSSAGGNWSDATKWTSRVPLPQDNVIVNSGTTGTLTADMPRLGADLTCTGFVGTISVPAVATVYGSLLLVTGMTWTQVSANFNFFGRGSHTLTTANKAFAFSVVFRGGGTYTLQDNWTSSSGALNLSSGTFNANNFNVGFGSGVAVNPGELTRTLNMGTGTWTLGNLANIWNVSASSGTVINASTSTIVFSSTSTARTFLGGGQRYNTLTYTVAGSTGSLTLTDGGNFFNTINFSDASNARSLLFTAGTTTAFNNFNVVGTAGKLMTIDSATAATHTLLKPVGTVSTDYLSVKNSIVDAGRWYAGANSTNVSGNTNWTFTAPPTPNTYSFVTILDQETATIFGSTRLNAPVTLNFSTPYVGMSVNTTLTANWNVLSTVSPTVSSYQWNVLFTVSPTVSSYQWSVLSHIEPTVSSYQWTVLSTVSPTVSSYQWNVLSTVSPTVSSYQWNSLSHVEPTVSSYQWNSLSHVEPTVSSYQWTVLSHIEPTVSNFNWNVLSTVSPTVSSYQWNVSAAVGSSLGYNWNVYSSVGPSVDYNWNVLSHIEPTVSSYLWNILSHVEPSISSYQWNVWEPTSPVDATPLGVAWNVLSVVDKTGVYQWQTLMAELGVGWAFNWNTLAAVGPSVDYQWNVLAPVTATSLVAGWNTLGAVSATSLGATWNILEAVGPSTDYNWNTLFAVGAVLSHNWNTRQALFESKINQWNVLSILNRTDIYNWNVLSIVDLPGTDFVWNSLGVASSSQQILWNTLQAVDKIKAINWNTLQILDLTATSIGWNVLQILNLPGTGVNWNVLQIVSPGNTQYNWRMLLITPRHVAPGEIDILSPQGFIVILSQSGLMDIITLDAVMDII